MKYTILISAILIMAGCGSSNGKDNSEPNTTVETDGSRPISPIIKEKEKIPPSIPVI